MVNEVKDVTRWQNKTRSVKQGAAYIGQHREELSDLLFVVKGREFPAHKPWVYVFSQQLWERVKAAVDDETKDRTIVHLTDVDPDAFEIILNYFYTRKIGPIPNPSLLNAVYKAAVDFGQQVILEHCNSIVSRWELTSDNVFPMLQMSSLGVLRDKCLEYLRTHAREVLRSEGVKAARDESLALMFENGYCEQIPVMELFSDIVGWSCNHFRVPSGDKMKEETEDRNAAVRAELMLPSGRTGRSLMGWIGFQRLTVEELTRAVADYPKLITDAEFTALVMYYYDKKKALPEWVVS